tara:strand:- start:34517 stop:34879 length:363 start_codon:yes stop_codon:yes gene_type:complete
MTQKSHSNAIFELTMSPAAAGQVAKGIKSFLVKPHPYIDTSARHRDLAVDMLCQITEYLASDLRTKFFFYKLYTQMEKTMVADVLNHGMTEETNNKVIDHIREQLFGAGDDIQFDNATSL